MVNFGGFENEKNLPLERKRLNPRTMDDVMEVWIVDRRID